MGQEADATANKGKPAKKQDQIDSGVMLWVESLQETKSIIDAASTAGTEAKLQIGEISKQVSEHRNMGWSNIEDIWGSPVTQGTRTENGGAELSAISKMRRLTDSWLKGAGELKTRLDSAVGTTDVKEKGAAGTMAQAGYTGDF